MVGATGAAAEEISVAVALFRESSSFWISASASSSLVLAMTGVPSGCIVGTGAAGSATGAGVTGIVDATG